MLSLLKLLLPALTPSWRFFDSVGPSPRIEYATPDGAWRAFRPRPAAMSARQMLRRLVWNADRNESLFLTSCAERLLESGDPHAQAEIRARLRADVPAATQFRIALVTRENREIAYVASA